jgi:alpha-1,2-mannosyltransferase
MLCFGSSIAMEEIMNMTMAVLSLIRPKKLKGPSSSIKLFRLLLGFILLTPFAVISISRSMALHHNYSAPLDVYRHYYYHHNHEVVQKGIVSATQQNEPEYYVCTAGEWYRFPSSFFLPSNTQFGFLKSSFTGQLPQPFTALGSKEESLTIQEGKYNDMNREEMDRYTTFSQCSYVVELVPSSSPRGSYAYDEAETALPECLQYMKSDVNSERSWTQVASYKYLDVMSTDALHRILYIPFRRTGKVKYKGYNLYSKMGGE